jgi:hypothetical protein
MRSRQFGLIEHFRDVEALDLAVCALKRSETFDRNFGGACDELQEACFHFSVEVVEDLPEPLDCRGVLAVVGVLGELAKVVD